MMVVCELNALLLTIFILLTIAVTETQFRTIHTVENEFNNCSSDDELYKRYQLHGYLQLTGQVKCCNIIRYYKYWFQQNVLFQCPAVEINNNSGDLSEWNIKSYKLYRINITTVPEFEHVQRDYQKLLDILSKYGHRSEETLLTGGAVRDLIRGTELNDLDFATTIEVDELLRIFNLEGLERINLRGIRFGTVSILIDSKRYDVSQLKMSSQFKQNHITPTWTDDVMKRDFTINALYLDINGQIYDYVDGYMDILKENIRFIGGVKYSIKENPFHILRYFRFLSTFYKKELFENYRKDLIYAIEKHAYHLNERSKQLIRRELVKIANGTYAKDVIPLMRSVGLFPYIGLPDSKDRNVNISSVIDKLERLQNLKTEFPLIYYLVFMNNVNDVDLFKSHTALPDEQYNLMVLFFNNSELFVNQFPSNMRPILSDIVGNVKRIVE